MKRRSRNAGLKGELARHIEKRMRGAGIGRRELARLSGASPAQVDRVLDPSNESVRLLTLGKVVRVVNPALRLVLVRALTR